MAHSRIGRGREKRDFAPLPETGTHDAIIARDNSDRSIAVSGQRSGWGGARNRADRVSHALTAAQVERLIAAAYQAWHMGLPFNRFWTVNLTLLGIDDRDGAKAVGRILKRASGWVKDAGGRFAAIWVREVGAVKGSHVHILMHIPAKLLARFKPMPRRWLKGIGSVAKQAKGTSDTRRVAGLNNCRKSDDGQYLANLWAVVSYICKGSSPDIVARYGLTKGFEPGGAVVGKRCGTTQNLRATCTSATTTVSKRVDWHC